MNTTQQRIGRRWQQRCGMRATLRAANGDENSLTQSCRLINTAVQEWSRRTTGAPLPVSYSMREYIRADYRRRNE